jgi:beta-N-acetylhexosaminidase
MSLGPVMVDIAGAALTPEERERLAHPKVGGVILFSRNYESPEQMEALVRELHRLRRPRLITAVDQEGGRVQRFRNGMTALPPMRRLGEIHDDNPSRAKRLADLCGWLLATELRAMDVDISFAPVLDMDHGVSGVIGDRAFHSDPEVISVLAHHFTNGMKSAGMGSVGKHFPGHGGVAEDSHHELPKDPRTLEELEAADLIPFRKMIYYEMPGIMTSHVLFPQIDSKPVTFSTTWLQQILRKQMGFQGVIFSDDLTMEAAQGGGNMAERANLALAAGCDMVLVCNNPQAADEVLDGLKPRTDPASHLRLIRMHGQKMTPLANLFEQESYQQAVDVITRLTA